MKKPVPQKQKGAVLLATTLILILGSAWLLIINLNNNARRFANYEESMQVLREAKQALIAYAVNYYESNPGHFGFLPCPDSSTTGEEGNQEAPCGAQYVNAMGKFPWQALDLPPLKDAYGQCLWYAVSGAVKGGSSRSEMLNEDTHGTFQIMDSDGVTVVAGATPRERPVAVIFAPGRSINNQTRTDSNGAICEGNEAVNYVASNYLDAEVPSNPLSGIRNYVVSSTVDTVDQFIMTDDPESEDFNDLMLYITIDEIFDAIKQRNDFAEKLYDEAALNNLTYRVAECIAGYGQYHADNHDDDGDGDYNRSLPWPARFDFADDDNRYRYETEYYDIDNSSLLMGRVPIDISNSNDEIYNGCSSPHTCLPPADRLIDSSTSPYSGFCKAFWLVYSDNPIGLSAADELIDLWSNWKDHLFYIVSEEYEPQPMGGDTDACLDTTQSPDEIEERCITINVPFTYPPNDQSLNMTMVAAIVIFSNETLPSLSQSRSAPPIDTDDKQDPASNLEDRNIIPYTTSDIGIDTEFSSNQVSATFNDILYCINEDTDETSIGGPPPFKAGRCPMNP
ncbi:MAG: hypothetical protein GWO08_07210 [Gammaproteobacteria bacterium]|nr:hypothetical protein [Gammaproteobacteria bacterium]NIO61778.1 hypothetical protein [Gammaproteobacteria bacterium]NIP48648.1 hypothetical protein [Gammaproteobacteria bacterium]NIQ09100.1 hypothetical protein [Gammaproteobacteria bacterium]NIQ19029.1 hypothetical protein [Gammaproteobacteria bacterium]